MFFFRPYCELEVPENSAFPIPTINAPDVLGVVNLAAASPIRVTAAYIGNSTYKMKGEGIDPLPSSLTKGLLSQGQPLFQIPQLCP